ncbi:MAG: phosphoribosylanthranilate isomerase [Gemmatimonadaceae bacterium]|nr:phosphoribosylanthranilate isomerase [Gemmatimonadaceae bacterium]
MTKIKFCGITRPVDAEVAASLGASHAGVIFAESPRRVTPLRAREIFASAGQLKRVGVFGHANAGEALRAARDAELDVMQLHGSFGPDDLARMRDDFEGELWPVVAIDESHGALPPGWDELVDVADAILLDTRVRGASGGTGRTFDWMAIAPKIRDAGLLVPTVLAGGLTPLNVGAAIAALAPAIVDVSSGVEAAPGIKDAALMRAFADAVRSASIV